MVWRRAIARLPAECQSKRNNRAGPRICTRDRMLDRTRLCLDHRPSIGSKNDHSYLPGGKVLLERNVLVAGYENLNSCLRGPIKQFSVRQPCPTHLIHGANVMRRQDPPNACSTFWSSRTWAKNLSEPEHRSYTIERQALKNLPGDLLRRIAVLGVVDHGLRRHACSLKDPGTRHLTGRSLDIRALRPIHQSNSRQS